MSKTKNETIDGLSKELTKIQDDIMSFLGSLSNCEYSFKRIESIVRLADGIAEDAEDIIQILSEERGNPEK